MMESPAMVRNPSALAAVLCALTAPAAAQEAEADREPTLGELKRSHRESQTEFLRHRLDQVSRQVDDLMIFQRITDVAEVDIAWITGPPLRHQPNPTAQGAGNPFRFYTYVFHPKGTRSLEEAAAARLSARRCAQQLRLGLRQRTARDARAGLHRSRSRSTEGAPATGARTYEAIDYGGLEIEDTFAARNYMLERYDHLDPKRVGILGWSHGGLHTLMNLFEHGDAYAVAYAGVPVSDLIARMGYKTQGYRDLYSVEYHIGKSAYEDVEEYRQALAVLERAQVRRHAAADPHQYQRRRRQRARSGAAHPGAQGRGQERLRVRDLRGRARWSCFRSHGSPSGPPDPREDLGLPRRRAPA